MKERSLFSSLLKTAQIWWQKVEPDQKFSCQYILGNLYKLVCTIWALVFVAFTFPVMRYCMRTLPKEKLYNKEKNQTIVYLFKNSNGINRMFKGFSIKSFYFYKGMFTLLPHAINKHLINCATTHGGWH